MNKIEYTIHEFQEDRRWDAAAKDYRSKTKYEVRVLDQAGRTRTVKQFSTREDAEKHVGWLEERQQQNARWIQQDAALEASGKKQSIIRDEREDEAQGQHTPAREARDKREQRRRGRGLEYGDF